MSAERFMWSVTIILTLSTIGHTASEALTGKIQWISQYSLDNWSDDYPKLICADSSGYYIVGQSSFYNNLDSYDYKLWIWRLDAQGKRLLSKPFLTAYRSDPNAITWDSDFVCPKNERMIFINQTSPHDQLQMIRFDEKGNTTFTEKPSISGYNITLRDISATNGGYLVCGRQVDTVLNSDVWVLKIDTNGKELWHKTYDRKNVEDGLSITAADNGTFTLAANSGDYDKSEIGRPDVWIIQNLQGLPESLIKRI